MEDIVGKTRSTRLSPSKVAAVVGVCVLAAVAYMTFKPKETQVQPQPSVPVNESAREKATVDPARETTTPNSEDEIITTTPASDNTRTIPEPIENVTANIEPEDEEVVVSATFDDDNLHEVVADNHDNGLAWSVTDGTARITGTTSDTVWHGDRFRDKLRLPLGIDARTNIEISTDFKIVKSNGFCRINFWSSNSLSLVYAGTPPGGSYYIDRRWMEYPTTLEGKESMPAFGDEMTKFHTMKIHIDRAKRQISYYADEVLLADVHYNEETEMHPLDKINVEYQTPHKGTEIEIHFDNLTARSFGPIY